MKITRLYSDSLGDSRFEEIDIPVKGAGEIGNLSKNYPVENLIFRETDSDYDYNFHNAPRRQFIIMLNGKIEIETSLGEKRYFAGGDILLVEDTNGTGHKTKSIDGKKRRSLFITIGENDVKFS